MTGRKGLTWVTALTIASLLLGGGALNALADEHGGGKGGNGRGGAVHQQQQQQKPAEVHQTGDTPATQTRHEDINPSTKATTASPTADKNDGNGNANLDRQKKDKNDD